MPTSNNTNQPLLDERLRSILMDLRVESYWDIQILNGDIGRLQLRQEYDRDTNYAIRDALRNAIDLLLCS